MNECPDGIAAQIITESRLLGDLFFGALKNDLIVVSQILCPSLGRLSEGRNA